MGGQYGYYSDNASGLYLLGHRYYDPGAGRFLNRDPIGYNGGINLYAYCGNNPINRADPSGNDYWLSCYRYWADIFSGRHVSISTAHRATSFAISQEADGYSYNSAYYNTIYENCVYQQQSIEASEKAFEYVMLLDGFGEACLVAKASGFLSKEFWYVAGQNIIKPRNFRMRGGYIVFGLKKAIKYTDEISTTSLRGKSLNTGEKILQKLGLVKKANDRGGFTFYDKNGFARIRWDRGLKKKGFQNHWHKFIRDNKGQIHELADNGHIVADETAPKVHITSQ